MSPFLGFSYFFLILSSLNMGKKENINWRENCWLSGEIPILRKIWFPQRYLETDGAAVAASASFIRRMRGVV